MPDLFEQQYVFTATVDRRDNLIITWPDGEHEQRLPANANLKDIAQAISRVLNDEIAKKYMTIGDA